MEEGEEEEEEEKEESLMTSAASVNLTVSERFLRRIFPVPLSDKRRNLTEAEIEGGNWYWLLLLLLLQYQLDKLSITIHIKK